VVLINLTQIVNLVDLDEYVKQKQNLEQSWLI